MRGTLWEPFRKPSECQGCPAEHNGRRFVPGVGELDECENFIVAEQPGENEDKEGAPLVGRTGLKVEQAVGGWGKVYRTNVRKCLVGKTKPEIKAATIKHCVEAYLIPEIERVCGGRPEGSVVITAIGADSTKVFLGTTAVQKYHGSTYTREEAEAIRVVETIEQEEEDEDSGVVEE